MYPSVIPVMFSQHAVRLPYSFDNLQNNIWLLVTRKLLNFDPFFWDLNIILKHVLHSIYHSRRTTCVKILSYLVHCGLDI